MKKNYLETIKDFFLRNKFIAAIIFVFIIFGALISFVTDIISILSSFKEEPIPILQPITYKTINLNDPNYKSEMYERLRKLSPGMDIAFIESNFGPSIISRHLCERCSEPKTFLGYTRYIPYRLKKNYIEKIYFLKYFILRTISLNNILLYYSVNVTNKNFYPKFDFYWEDFKLCTKPISTMNLEIKSFFYNYSSKFVCYAETYEMISGIYSKGFQLGYSPIGPCGTMNYTEFLDMAMNENAEKIFVPNNSRLKKFRKSVIPNVYSVFDLEIDKELYDFIEGEMTGFDYFEYIEFNAK